MPAGDAMSLKTYADSFWGGELNYTGGAEALQKRNKDSKTMCHELEEYLKKRSKLEAEYSKGLSGLAKCIKQRDAIGVLEATFNKYKEEIESMAQVHQTASALFQQRADTVKMFKEKQMATRKGHEDTLQKTQNSKLSQLSKTLQLEKAYVRKSCERDTALLTLKDVNHPHTPPKEVEKAKAKAAKAEDEADKSDSAYRSAIKVLDDCTGQWEHDMLVACQAVQELDEERIDFLRKEIWTCVNQDSQLALETDEICEKVREILEKCDIVSDIQAFIVAAGTGEEHPDHLVFRHYTKIMADVESKSDSSNDNPYNCVEDDNNKQDSSSQGTSTWKKVLPKPLRK